LKPYCHHYSEESQSALYLVDVMHQLALKESPTLCLGVTVNKHTVISTLFYCNIAATNQQNQKHEEDEAKCHRTDQTKPEIEWFEKEWQSYTCSGV